MILDLPPHHIPHDMKAYLSVLLYPYPVKDRKVGDDSCPYCAGKKILTGFNDLQTVNPQLAKEWSPNNEFSASRALPTLLRTALWICPDCNGEYPYPVKDRKVGDDSCPYCAGKKILKGYNDLQTTHPELMCEWSEIDNALQNFWPDEITEHSSISVWWVCKDCGYKYKMSPRDKLIYAMRHQISCSRCKGRRRNKVYIG
ncbi:MAG: zinc-ribbon domain-containing protein [Firmicutes bacterium]|nr:zinc-ribbon domain-containing protein [Bacillota bacterium]